MQDLRLGKLYFVKSTQNSTQIYVRSTLRNAKLGEIC